MVKTGLIWSGLLLLITTVASAVAWFQLPADAAIAVHWSLGDGGSRYAGKLESLLLMPAFIATVIVLFSISTVMEPRQKNLQKSAAVWLGGWIGSSAIFAIIHGFVLYGAFTGAGASDKLVPVLASLLCIGIGNYLAKSRSNWISFPIPWALQSEHAWIMASRIRGWGFVLTGALGLIVCLFFSGSTARVVLISGAIATILVGVVVSYFAWRDDPERAG